MSSARAGVAKRLKAASATMVRIGIMIILAARITTENLAQRGWTEPYPALH
jgi:hypothetical protein